ncbi:TetR family transcriptional regulator [Mycobacterium sp. 852002-50816_SCH5313054-b]|uniref:TetR/AcrR family transcriptional regulator n=1 Tax=Mycobacterium sp. 852002-50816_SCH5313054-b TaxID=1834092 RepID=UPI0007FE0399|nr:TetR/AcrR family transcriptional regulator [Mycobacterium sp. 852002-50816_SCH5313054-b]OBF47891.1 TetR family transcriptional regulator [Mycobacterium sp. 852002-50816_SCH5313054-b]
MTSATRRRRAVSDEDKSQRRDQIMAAAKEVFARKGFHATTIADIAKRAGLAYGSVYWYFDSKDELFHALMAAEEGTLRDHVVSALAAAGVPAADAGHEEPLRVAVRATLEFFESDKATVQLLLRDPYAMGERFEKHLGGIYERFIDDIETFIVAAQARGEVVAAPPRMVAYALAALVGQLAHRRLRTDDDVTAAEVADFVVALALDGLRPREAG